MEAMILDLTEDQIVKTDFAEVSERLGCLAREVGGLSAAQPDLQKCIVRIQKELRSIDAILGRRRPNGQGS
jgi:hypothetical protein